MRGLPVEVVAERLGMRVSRHKALCPFHEDRHPSLCFNVRTNTYKCFVCGAHGDPISLAMRVLGRSFPDACRWLADTSNVILEERMPAVKQVRSYPPDVDYLQLLVARPELNECARRFLFEERRLSPKVIEWCGISSIDCPTPCWRYGKAFYDAPSLLFPYRDIDGVVQNVQSRYLGHEGGVPRFRFPMNSSIHVFNLPILRHLKHGEPLFISEGITDCLALLSSGYKAIAIPSATLLRADDLNVIAEVCRERGSSWHVFPDNDLAGERLYGQLVSVSLELGVPVVRHSLPGECKDFGEYYLKKG